MLGKAEIDVPRALEALQTQLRVLETKLEALDRQINGDPETKEFRGIRFQNDGAWAIHYSTVRLTIATFVITTCITIAGFKWEHLSLSLVFGVLVIDLLGLFAFYWFTHETLKVMVSQRARIGVAWKMADLWKKDAPSYLVGVFGVLYALVVTAKWILSLCKVP
ncbi:MAG TPA: hypothetical protein VLW52_14760 [Opitutaceae bacterium]|nr:hypothetical protein [Opitutaceae bacterium]